MASSEDSYTQFTKTYSGRRLLEEHSLDEMGIWTIYGEDPNCDLGGSHHQPNLGTIEGKLDDVIRAAVTLPGFWQWGGGGRIDKIDIQKAEGRTVFMGTARKLSNYSFTSPSELFDLIKKRTEEGKITWKGTSKLEGSIPGSGMRIELTYTSDQRDGDWYQLLVNVNGKVAQVGTADQIKALRKYIVEKPSNDALSEAREILEKL